MKIIKIGEIPKSRYPMEITCWNCKTEMEVVASDTQTGQYNGTVVECPICKSYIDIPETKSK